MADNDDLQAGIDLAQQLNSLVGQLSQVMGGVNSNFGQTVDSVSTLKDLLEDVVATSSKYQKNFITAGKLEASMKKNRSLLARTEKDIVKYLEKEAKIREKEIRAAGKAEGQSQVKIAEAVEDSYEFYKSMTEDVKTRVSLMDKEAKLAEREQLAFANMKSVIDDLGDKIRNPDKGFQSMLASAGEIPKKMFDAKKEGKSFGDVLSAGLGKITNYASLLLSPAGLFIVGFAAATAAATVLYKVFKNYFDFLDKKVMPAQAAFNREIGSSSQGAKQLRQDAISTGVQFEMLGLSFQDGAKFVNDFAKGLGFTSMATKEAQQLGKELTLVMGFTAEESGNLIMQFNKQGKSLQDVREMMSVAEKGAQSYGLVTNEVMRDLGRSPNVLARFGTANRREFAEAAVKARSYGLDIQKVTDAFGKQLDTFDNTANASAKLNAVFGTQINSMELMLETNPTKRMEMLRKELEKQGKSWESLNAFERNVITSQMGVDEQTAALILSSEKERRTLQAKAKEREKQIKLDEKWNKQLGDIKETLIAWEPLLDKLMREFANFVVLLFGGESASDTVTSTAQIAENAIKSITNAIRGASADIDNYRNLWYEMTEMWDSGKAEKAVELINKQKKTTAEQLQLNKLLNDPEVIKKAEIKMRLNGMDNAQVKEKIKLEKDLINTLEAKKLQDTITALEEKSGGGLGMAFGGRGKLSEEEFDLLKKSKDQFASILANPTKVDDALITKKGEVVKLNPNDNVMAYQGETPPGGTKKKEAGNPGVSMKEIENIVKGVLAGMGQTTKLEVVDVNLDGKKVGEMQVRLSRY